MEQAKLSGADQAGGSEAADSAVPNPAPQLVKTASLTLITTDVDTAVSRIKTLVDQAGGDLLNLQDYRTPEGIAPEVSLTLRVPQAQLEQVIEAIRPLGTVQSQTITAEDVSDQLVDLTARLRNLHKSEESLLKIMDRSGDMADVLQVSRELSTVRDGIERLAAQQQQLQRQVAYSTLTITLQSPVAATVPLRPLGETLGQTWQTASRSMQEFSVGLLKLSLWLLAYSPYLLLIGGIGFWGHRFWRHRNRSPQPRPEPAATPDNPTH